MPSLSPWHSAIGNRKSAISSRQVLYHQVSVVAAGVVSSHASHDLVAEIQIESLRDGVRSADLKTDRRYSTLKKALFHLVHQPPAEAETPMFRRDSERHHVTGAVGFDHSYDKREHLIGW